MFREGSDLVRQAARRSCAEGSIRRISGFEGSHAVSDAQHAPWHEVADPSFFCRLLWSRVDARRKADVSIEFRFIFGTSCSWSGAVRNVPPAVALGLVFGQY